MFQAVRCSGTSWDQLFEHSCLLESCVRSRLNEPLQASIRAREPIVAALQVIFAECRPVVQHLMTSELYLEEIYDVGRRLMTLLLGPYLVTVRTVQHTKSYLNQKLKGEGPRYYG